MTAWHLANKALDRVLENWLTALWLSFPVFIYLVVVLAALNIRVLDALYWGDVAGAASVFFVHISRRMILTILAVFFAANWVAVAWHRFVLLNEGPTGLGPNLHLWPVIWYSIYLFLVFLALFVLFLLLSLLVSILAMSLIVGLGDFLGIGDYSVALEQGTFALVLFAVALNAIVSICFVYLFLRFALKLPAIAVGEPLTLRDALGYGRHHRRLFLALAVGYTLITLLWGLVGVTFENAHWTVAIVMEFGFNWLAFMFLISVITELYKEFVRPSIKIGPSATPIPDH